MAVKELPWTKPRPGTDAIAHAAESKQPASPLPFASGVLASTFSLLDITNSFPAHDLAFGYGSGVFAQTATTTTATPASPLPMLDLIFSVPCAASFHSQNMKSFPDHYPIIPRLLPAKAIAHIQRDYGAGMWFNPLVNVPASSRQIKYGVISTPDLLEDLKEWKYLYVAGRMHKPIGVISTSDDITAAMSTNHLAGLAAGFLTLPAGTTTTTAALFASIASLSYTGDPRMSAGAEDPNKVQNLVGGAGQRARWTALYKPHLQALEAQGIIGLDGEKVSWDHANVKARRDLLGLLPAKVSEATRGEATAVAVTQAMASVVARTARGQSVKGVFTAGLSRSLVYAAEKFKKGLLKKKS